MTDQQRRACAEEIAYLTNMPAKHIADLIAHHDTVPPVTPTAKAAAEEIATGVAEEAAKSLAAIGFKISNVKRSEEGMAWCAAIIQRAITASERELVEAIRKDLDDWVECTPNIKACQEQFQMALRIRDSVNAVLAKRGR